MISTAPFGPMTAISAVGHATLKSPRMCFELMTSYAPPYALRVMTVSLGTVASQYANNNLAPCLMMPPCSCAVPGRNPGTSSNVTSGMLNASQKRMKRAPLSDAAMSSTPEDRGLVGHDADAEAAQVREAADDVLCVVALH